MIVTPARGLYTAVRTFMCEHERRYSCISTVYVPAWHIHVGKSWRGSYTPHYVSVEYILVLKLLRCCAAAAAAAVTSNTSTSGGVIPIPVYNSSGMLGLTLLSMECGQHQVLLRLSTRTYPCTSTLPATRTRKNENWAKRVVRSVEQETLLQLSMDVCVL